MANGAAALHVLDEPAPDPRQEEIGEAVAAAATMIACAIEDCRQGGSLAPATKAVGADRLTRVTMLALDHELGDQDFFSKAREFWQENFAPAPQWKFQPGSRRCGARFLPRQFIRNNVLRDARRARFSGGGGTLKAKKYLYNQWSGETR